MIESSVLMEHLVFCGPKSAAEGLLGTPSENEGWLAQTSGAVCVEARLLQSDRVARVGCQHRHGGQVLRPLTSVSILVTATDWRPFPSARATPTRAHTSSHLQYFGLRQLEVFHRKRCLNEDSLENIWSRGRRLQIFSDESSQQVFSG